MNHCDGRQTLMNAWALPVEQRLPHLFAASRSSRGELERFERWSGGALALLRLLVAIKYVADARTLAGELGEIAGGRLDRRVPQPGLDLLNRHTLVGQRRGVVAAQRMRMG